MDTLSYVDLLFKEYLVFRGFSASLEAFGREAAADPGLQYRADAFTAYLFDEVVANYRLQELTKLLALLKARIFCHLSADLSKQVVKLEASLLKCLLVTAVSGGHAEVVVSFFQSQGPALAALRGPAMDEWRDWFALPHVAAPAHDARFQVYFNPQWREMVRLSFRNLLAQAVQAMPLPTVLRFHADRQERQALQQQLQALRQQLQALQQDNAQLHAQLQAAGAGAGGVALDMQLVQDYVSTDRSGAAVALGGDAKVGSSGGTGGVAEGEDAVAGSLVASSPIAGGDQLAGEDGAAGGLVGVVMAEPDETIDKSGPWRIALAAPPQQLLHGHEGAARCAAFSPAGGNVATGGDDGVVRVWAPSMLRSGDSSADRGALARAAALNVGGGIAAIAWDSRADKVMLMGVRAKGIKAWHVDTKRMVAHVQPEGPSATPLALACSPTDALFGCCLEGGDGCARLTLWNTRTFKRLHTFALPGDPSVRSCAFSAEGRLLAAGASDGSVRLVDPAARGQAAALQVAGSRDAVLVAGTPLGRHVAALTSAGRLQVWDVAAPSAPVADVAVPGGGARLTTSGYGHRLGLSPDGRSVLCASDAVAAPLVTNTGGECAVQALHCGAAPAPVHAVAWHPSEDVVLTSRGDGVVRLVRLERAG